MKKSIDNITRFIVPREAEQERLLGVCSECDMRQSIGQQKALFREGAAGRFALILCTAYKNGGELTRPAFYPNNHLKCTRRSIFVKKVTSSHAGVTSEHIFESVTL